MNPPLPPKTPPAIVTQNPAAPILENALGARQRKNEIIKKHMGYWDPPKAPGNKAYSSHPKEIDL